MLRWFKRSSPAATLRTSATELESIRQYRVTRKLGEGGMGVVYEARDERLGRLVAIKRVRGLDADTSLKQRLWREARVAAGISHPNICQVYELAEEGGELFVVMELLTGDTLADRIAQGSLPIGEALQITLGMLVALEAVHARGVIHRDLKPSNVFLTEHGVKLLDFGLARHDNGDPQLNLTRPGTIIGTPRYMAPEVLSDGPVGPAADLFAVGTILFEMLTGKPAFTGRTIYEVYAALLNEQPPPLVGGSDVMAADAIIQRALAKDPANRYPAAAEMAREVREAITLLNAEQGPSVRTMTRLIVLPFKLLRPDAEIDFLGYSLPEAITESLAGLETLTVRSPAAAARLAADNRDLSAIAAEARVDMILLGTLLRAEDQIRVTIQLVEAATGTVILSRNTQSALTNIFKLQDELTEQIVEGLAVPLTSRDAQRRHRDVSTSAEAYQLYLRATHICEGSSSPARLTTARDLYLRCVELDPKYAPAWARLGRVHRVLGKYGYGDIDEERRRAAQAFRTALELNPDLALAHNLYTYFEIEEFAAAPRAMLRLLGLIERQPADPDLYAGLVVACRFCGLLQASLAADRRARRIDPAVRTSVHYTHWSLGNYEQTALTDLEEIQALRYAAYWMMGRREEAMAAVRQLESQWPASEQWYLKSLRGAFENDRDECVNATRRLLDSGFRDPEGLVFCARNLARVRAGDFALELLGRIADSGFHCADLLVHDPWFDSIRTEHEFVRVLQRAREGSAEAAAAFAKAGGERLLGLAV